MSKLSAKTFLQSDEWNTRVPITVSICEAMEAYHAAAMAEVRKEVEALKEQQGAGVDELLKSDLGSALPLSVARHLGYDIGSRQSAIDLVLAIIDKHIPKP